MSIVENTILEGHCSTNVKGAGRPKGSQNVKAYKWKVIIFDNSTKSFKEGKYTSVNHINQELNLNLNSDYVRRIMTKYSSRFLCSFFNFHTSVFASLSTLTN